jgi:hypothetical protein
MKTYKIILFAMALFLLPSYSYSLDLGTLRTSLIEGDVQIKTQYTSEWFPAAVNMPLRKGDRFWIPEDGRLEIQLNEGSFLRLDKNSSLEIESFDENAFQFYLAEGRAYVNFRGLRDDAILIETPGFSVYAYDRSNFKIDLSRHGYQEVSVLNGLVYVEERSGRIRVSAGKTLSLKGDNYADISLLGHPDAWERWNRDRDRIYEERRYSYRYLPEELKIHSYDLDTYGKWAYTNEYGYVWRPTVVVSAGWAPYRLGRWAWIGGDYVWVSYEPWGWAPYHYGRWAFRVSLGWFWVPPVRGSVYWGPGYVGWVHTPTYVSWIPLAPDDIYYGYGYFGSRSVNIININIYKTVIKNVYRNVYIEDAVTVVHRDTFIRNKHVNFRIKKNPFLHKKISIGRPDIKPERTSFMPVIREIPPAKQPPKHIRNMRDIESKKRRAFVTKRTGADLRSDYLHNIKSTGRNRDSIIRKSATPGYKKPDTRSRIQPIEKQQVYERKSFTRDNQDIKSVAPQYRGLGKQRYIETIEKRQKKPYEASKHDRRVQKSSKDNIRKRTGIPQFRNSSPQKQLHAIEKRPEKRVETVQRARKQKITGKQPTRSSESRYSAAQKLSNSPEKIQRRSNSRQSPGYSTNRVQKERKAHVSVNKKSGRINRTKKR